MARIWLRRKNQVAGKHYAVHELCGVDTSCMAVRLKGMNLANYEVTAKVYDVEHVCSACQSTIAERRGRF